MTDSISEEIIENYKDFEEDKRLSDAFGRFEKEQTKDLILRYCKKKELTILDVGGATGAYSFWLAGLNHNVYLVDIVPKHIEISKNKTKNENLPVLKDYIVGDARKLPFEDNFADLLIMHGPLYHFTNRKDRIDSIQEANRVLKPGGTLLAFTITRYAGVNYGIREKLMYNDIYYSVIKNEVLNGIRDNNPKKIKSFLKAYFHLPNEIEEEIKACNFQFEKTIGILGTTWTTPDLKDALEDPIKLQRLKEISCLLENEPVLSPRMMSVGVKN